MVVRSLFRLLSSVFIVFLLSAILIVTCSYYYLTHTTQGAKWVFDLLTSRYLGAQSVKYRGIEGTIADGIKLSNIRIQDLNKFTTRNLILIQHLDLMIPGMDMDKIQIKIRNGRIKFPLSDPIGFYGTFKDGLLKFNVYCGIIDVREIVTVIKSDLSLHNLKGTANKASLAITGPYYQPVLIGDFLLEDFRYLGFSLAQLPATFQYTLNHNQDKWDWQGVLSVPSGIVKSRLTTINLNPSKLIFKGPFKNPDLEIKGSAKVNQTLINISLEGSKKKPVLNVTSNPPKSKNALLVLLATGQEVITPHNVTDPSNPIIGSDNAFVEYFTFTSEGLSPDAVGLTDFSFNMQDNAKWLGIKRKVTNQVKVGINLQETRASTGQVTDVTRSVGGEVQVSDHITVGVDKKVTQIQDPAQNQSTPQQKDGGMDVMIKYKKSF
jgi:hypothetical protein